MTGAEAKAERKLETAYRTFLAETEPELKSEAGRELIRAVFGEDSIAEDPVF
jgi:hypothetical protein